MFFLDIRRSSDRRRTLLTSYQVASCCSVYYILNISHLYSFFFFCLLITNCTLNLFIYFKFIFFLNENLLINIYFYFCVKETTTLITINDIIHTDFRILVISINNILLYTTWCTLFTFYHNIMLICYI